MNKKEKSFLTPEQKEALSNVIDANLVDIFFNPKRETENSFLTISDLLKPIETNGGKDGN